MKYNDEFFMKKALELAVIAFDEDEIPVGAVVVRNNEIIGCGYNQKETLKNPLKHAELIAIEEACKKVGDWRLNDCEIYVTLEPCKMCMGAIVETRIKRVVYGVVKNEQSFDNCKSIENCSGILKNECLQILQTFFKNRRNK